MTIAVLLVDGFEEIEAITPVDVLRRAGFAVEVLGFSKQVTGSHGLTLIADKIWDGKLSSYQMVILPGGLPGANHLRDDERLIKALIKSNQAGVYLAAICAAPKVFGKAGLLADKVYTCYPGVEIEINQGRYSQDVVVVDGNIITGKGAGASLEFSYRLVEILGGDSQSLRQGMIYADLFK